MNDKIIIKGARENNLKNINVEIPKNKMVIITGVSGSGKSSLAFDTIYAEGQRRYLESLSSYARQFLGGNKKPDVDLIEGLCPSIAIDQKTTNHNPRSTVGTVTEIYDFLRILFARIGTPYCPNGHGIISTMTLKQIVDKISDSFEDGDKIQILAPVIENKKGSFKNELEKLKLDGFNRVKIDNQIYLLDDEINLNKNDFHNIDIVIDRIVGHKDNATMSRINDAVELAIKQTSGQIKVLINDIEKSYSETNSCSKCGFSLPELEPRLFSFNSPIGACEHCKGLGFTYEPDENKIIPNKKLSINEGGIDYFKNSVGSASMDWQKFDALIKHYKINKDKPIEDLTDKQLEIILKGSDEPISYTIESSNGNIYKKTEYIEGVSEMIKRRHIETTSEGAREFYSRYMSEITCPVCKGKKLSKAALSVKINDKNIIDVTDLTIDEAIDFFLNLQLTQNQKFIANLALKEIVSRLSFLKEVGLEYITLSRSANTLSGGEAQRIRLATQIGSSLTGILYVLDEPSIGLHQKDNAMLIKALKNMRDLGNTLIVVEHDLETIEESDYIIDVGPGAGNNGGNITATGNLEEIKNNKNSLTGKYLKGEYFIPIPSKRRSGDGRVITIKGAKENNLKNVDVSIPLGKFICVTGVSGSGKSTLVETLTTNIQKSLFNPFISAPKIKSLTGHNDIEKIIFVSQEPIGRTPRSNPATYIGLFDDIRELYAQLPESKARGWTKSRFSFNIPGGRCEKCWGDGTIRIQMHFLPDVYVTCDECNGKRYNDETLKVKYKGKSIYDILEMTVAEATEFFTNIPSIRHKLDLLNDVGLGYIKLGLNADNLSGGEAQRIKLAKFLQKKANKNTMLVLDEPTTGLHIDDVKKIIAILDRIADNGTTVIVIEHNLDLIKCADYIIDIGPNGGNRGGEIVAVGTPEQVANNFSTHTAKYLKKVLK